MNCQTGHHVQWGVTSSNLDSLMLVLIEASLTEPAVSGWHVLPTVVPCLP